MSKTIIHLKPNDSDGHLYLRSLATVIGVPELSIRKLLFFLNAPGYLVAFVRIMHNMRRGITLFAQENGIVLQEGNFLYDVQRISQYVEKHRDALETRAGDCVMKGETRGHYDNKNPTFGLWGLHPIYSILWNTHHDLEYQDRYLLLQMHVFFASAQTMESHTTIHAYESHNGSEKILLAYNSSLESAGRKIRELRLKESSHELDELFLHVGKSHRPISKSDQKQTFFSIAYFYNRVVRAHATSLDETFHQNINCFALLFKQAYKGKKARRRVSGNIQEQVLIRSVYGYDELGESTSSQGTMIMDTFDLDDHIGSQRVIQGYSKKKELAEIDSAPTENDSGLELYLTEYDGELSSFLSRLFAAKGQVRHIILRNQMLRTSWSQMTTWEVAQLIFSCKRKFISLLHKDDNGRCSLDEGALHQESLLELEAITLLMVMLWAGKTLAEAVTIVVDDSDKVGDAELVFIQGENKWRLLPFMITEKAPVSSLAVDMSRDREPYVYLPSVINMNAFFKNIQKFRLNTPCEFFNRPVSTYEQSIKTFLSELPEGHRVTIPKVSTYMFHLLATEGDADVTDAIISTATYHSLGQTQLHYTTPGSAHIQNKYAQMVQTVIIDACKEDGSSPQSFLEFDPSPPNLNLGSRLCPKKASVQHLVQYLQDKISVQPCQKNMESYVIYHNYFTIYTSLMLGYATGYRAVTNPFIEQVDMDSVTGMALISDKDGESCYNTRLVWIPNIVQQQIKYYTKHVKKLNSLIKKQKYPCNLSASAFMFLLSHDFKVQELRPKHIMPYIAQPFPFPLNVNRRYLRTELKQRGCAIEIINAFMGHWQLGEEPWGKHSSLSMLDYKHELQQHIDPILEEMSWVAIGSVIT